MRGGHLVTLEMRIQAADGGTGITETFADVGQVWAALGGVSGVMNIGETQIEAGVTHRFVMRWVDPSTFSHIAAKGGAQRFRVRGTRDPDGRQRMLEVMAEEERSEVVA